MIRILYITPNFTIGGTEGQILNIATNLDRSRFVANVISIGSNQGQRELYAKRGVETGIFRITDFFSIVEFIKVRKIDVVHSFYYGNFSGWELVASKLAGVKIFITSRRNMGYWRKARHAVFDMFRNNFTDVVIANSYAVRERTITDEKIHPSKVIVVYNGVDFSKYSLDKETEDASRMRARIGIKADEKVVGMVSNIKNIKGYEYFLAAAKIIKERGHKIKFAVAGEGSDEERFKRIVDEYGLRGSLVSLGLCKDVSSVFAIIDIFMYSSLSEGFSNVILEAMACGKPIVATDVGGTSEMLKDGYSGMLVPPRDAESLARATINLLENEKMADNLAANVKSEVAEYFRIEECVSQYEFIYEDSVNMKNKPAS